MKTVKVIKVDMPCQKRRNPILDVIKVEVKKVEEPVKDKFLSHPLFKDYFVREAGVFAPETECWRFAVPGHDDMEVSVIRSSMTYGGDEGLFELAMLRDDKCCYDTPITDDVRGWLEVEDVLDILEDVQRIYGEEA